MCYGTGMATIQVLARTLLPSKELLQHITVTLIRQVTYNAVIVDWQVIRTYRRYVGHWPGSRFGPPER